MQIFILVETQLLDTYDQKKPFAIEFGVEFA